MKNLIGKRIDERYEILEHIGVGGMADVYKAYDVLKSGYVAIKVLKEKFLGNEEFIYRFRNESKANASLSHPNIVRIFDVGFGNKLQYIVMEYVEGVTLKEYIEKAKVLNWKDVVHFTFQILRGLQHAHDKGIVHRDIKPQNIMLLEDGTVKIMDFGIARFPKDEKINGKKAVGSVHYISPEQAIGGITDFKSDIYSVGIIMYEMLTGMLPFDGKTPEIVAQKQIKDAVISPLEINPNLPQGLVDIILRAIKKKPQDRYQSAEEMLHDIDEFKQNPDMSFGYKYFDDIENTRYFGALSDLNMSNLQNRNIIPTMRQGIKPKKKKEKLVPILIGVAGGFFLLAVVMIITFMVGRGRNSVEDIEIPNFVGTNIEEVKVMNNGKYKDLGYTVTYEPSSKYNTGTIMEQSIKPGTQVKSNYGNISFTVSSGIEKKTIPNVVGMSFKSAEEKLKKAGFIDIKRVEKIDEEMPAGAVVGISPKALTEAVYDTPITLYCNASLKDENVLQVPNVIGKTLEEAKEELKSSGFEVAVKEISDPEKTPGVVVAQNKEKATLGSTVEIVYNVKDSKKMKKFIPNEDDIDSIIKKEKEKNKKEQHQNKPLKEQMVEIPIKSSVKTSDPFHVFVVDSQNNIVSETGYTTGKASTISFKAENSFKGRYKIMIKNDKTGKTAQYGTVKVIAGENGYDLERKITCDPNAFLKTLSFDDED